MAPCQGMQSRDSDVLGEARMRMKLRRGHPPGAVQIAILLARRALHVSWSGLGELLGVSPGTVRGWSQAEPIRPSDRLEEALRRLGEVARER